MLEQYPGRIEAIETTPDAPTANVGAPQAHQMQQGSGGGRAVSSATDTVPAMSNCTAPVAGHRTEAGRRACPVHGANPAASAPLPPSLAPAPEPVSTYKRLEHPDGSVEMETWYVGDKLHRTDGPAVVRYRRGAIESESWYVDGKPHRIDGPAVVWYRPDGTVEAESWWVGGVNHRTDGPAYVRYYLLDGTVSSETWLAEGKRHRTDGPARVLYHPDGTTVGEEWYVDDKLHRTDEPAYVRYRPDGTVESEAWWADGECHRDDGPAVVEYRPDGSVEREEWWVGGERHRIDGPARVWYRPDGAVEREAWFVDGAEVEPWEVLGRYLTTRGVPGLSTEALKQVAKDVPWQRWSELGPDHPLVRLWGTVHPSAEISAG